MASGNARPRSYTVLGLLAAGVLYFVLDLSRGDRHLVDFVVIGLVVAAIGWNVLQLTRRLHAALGARGSGHVARTVGLWVVGAMNSVYAPAAYEGRWTVIVGWAMLVAAALDTVALYRRERTAIGSGPGAPERSAKAS